MPPTVSALRLVAAGAALLFAFAPRPAAAAQLVVNGDFSAGQAPWWLSNVTADTTGEILNASVPAVANPWEAIVGQSGLAISNGALYTLTFDAWSETPANVAVLLQLDGPPFTAYFSAPVALGTTSKKYSYTFTSPVTDAAVLQFQLGGTANGAFTFHLDNVSLETTVQLIENGDFAAGQGPWWLAGVTADTSGGTFNVTVPAVANPWEAIVGQAGVALASGVVYTLSFDAWASTAVSIQAIVQLDGPPFTGYFNTPVALTMAPQHFSYTFTSPVTDPAAAIQFQLGANPGHTFHLDNVSLTAPAEPEPLPPPSRLGELLRNGSFTGGQVAPWWTTSSISAVVASGRLEASMTDGGANPWDAIVGQGDVPVFATGQYTLRLKAWATQGATVNVILQKDGPPFTQYYGTPIALTTTPKSFVFTFTSPVEDQGAVLQLQMGGQGSFTVYLDNLSLVGPIPNSMFPSTELVANGGFGAGRDPWWLAGNIITDTSSGALQATVASTGPNPWDTIIGQNNVPIFAGVPYTLRFKAWASMPVSIRAVVQKDGAPFTAYFATDVPLAAAPTDFAYTFTSLFEDEQAQIQFQIGGHGPFVFYVDDVSLVGPRPIPPPQFLTAVRANQNGYLPRAPKRATIAADVTTPLAWTLFDAADAAVATGTTTVSGTFTPSAEHLHVADFSAVRTPGTGYTLEVYGERTHPFDIGDGVYDRLEDDALRYFFHNRAGIEIAMPFAGEAQWARPAGHLGVAPNQGDLGVTCFNQTDSSGQPFSGCDYTLDVPRGWYDAGDHGKYVVNAGFAAWMLLNQYERTRHTPGAFRDGHPDGSLNIPESANGVPDVLDEARWEVEFLLAMQVPPGGRVEGTLVEGMAHHKLHDANWTGLGLPPHLDAQPRYLYPPSTAATLNLAAVAAQCARVWKRLDRAFADRCLHAAEIAWDAALAHPAMYALETFPGGGGYGDHDVSDEFYWAAAELFVTTGRPRYRGYVTRSPLFLGVPGTPDGNGVIYGRSMDWPATQALGTISLAVVPNDLASSRVRAARRNIVDVADGYLAALAREPYGIPYASDGGYFWGSNSAVLDNMVIVALAYDFTSDRKYLDAVSEGMDYILGRNPLVKSYVSGYGERPMENPHHRFWAHQADPALPPPAPGALAGGPNMRLDDPFARAFFSGGCAPQTCYVDDIESFSTNEVAINWNAPLAWTAAFLDGARALQSRGAGR